MRGNFFVCGNRVVVEGKDVGQFESIEVTEDRDNLSSNCTITLPVYAIGMNSNAPTSERLRQVLADALIVPCARIDIYTFYHNSEVLEQEFEEVLQFSGYIRQVIGGFPSTIICEDHSFVLRFGTIGRDWPSKTSLKTMIEYIVPISNTAFQEYRRLNGFPDYANFPHLSFDETRSAEVQFALEVWKNISPFEALTKLMKLFTLYSYVTNEGKVYFGIGVDKDHRRTVQLATNTNVIGRNIIPTNGMFVNYKVVVSGLMKDGTRYTYELGDTEGEAERFYSPLDTQDGIKQVANSVMQRLRGDRNKGTIQTVLYPELRMYDYIIYTDTLFPELSGNYYTIGRKFTGNVEVGFIQEINVTDEIFVL